MPAKNTAKKSTRHNNNQVRIIAGDWRGRKLSFPNIPGLRPTGDRMRETLFNWLTPYLYQSNVLDLFAGSGALGMEALSRGAGHCLFVEANATAARGIADNLAILKCEKGQVRQQSAFDVIDELRPRSIDLLLLDPPFDSHLHMPVLDKVCQAEILTESSLVYIEAPVNEDIGIPSHWQLLKEKASGQVNFSLYLVEHASRGGH